MKQKYVIGLAAILALGLVTQVPFGLMKQEQNNNPLAAILSTLQSIDTKLDTIIILLTPPEPPSGPGFNSPIVQIVTYTPSVPEAGDTVWLDIVVYDEDIAVHGLSQALDVNSEFVQLPPLSLATLVPSIGHNPAFIPDRPGDYGIRVTVTDDTGRFGWLELTITVAETPPPP